MNKKISTPIAISVIVALTVLVGGIVVWQYLGMSRIETSEFKPAEKVQPADETADWKTYRNKELGFGIKYPPYLKAEKDINNPDRIIINDIDPYNDPCVAEYDITIDETEYEDIDKWAIDFQKDIEEPFEYEGAIFKRTVISIENIDIQGKTGKRISLGPSSFPFFNEHIGIINNDKFYLIQYILLSSCQEKEENEEDIIFNQILSTFKFVEPVYDLYKNDKYRYEISILPGWEVENTSGFEQKTITKTNKNSYSDFSLRISAESDFSGPESGLLEWIKNNKYYQSEGYTVPQIISFKIDGHNAIRLYYQALPGGIPSEETFIANNGTLFHFTCLVSFEEYPDYSEYHSSEECDGMLKTFKLI